MKKSTQIIIVILVIVLVVAFTIISIKREDVFSLMQRIKQNIGIDGSPDQLISTEIKESPLQANLVRVFVGDNELSYDSSNLVLTGTLKPSFRIEHEDGLNIESLIIDKIDVLSDDFFIKKDDVKVQKNIISFTLPFLLKLGQHDLSIKISDFSVFDIQFNIGVIEKFKSSVEDSESLIIPDSTKNKYGKSWFVQNEKLKIEPVKEGGHASLAFLYPLKDVFASFEFIPSGKKINLVFYFLESGKSIVIGNGNNKRITALRGLPNLNVAIEGEMFEMLAGETYSALITRYKGQYRLYVTKGKLRDIDEENNDSRLLIDFRDALDEEREDHMGFSVWEGSDGVEIDNLTISTVNHDRY